MGKVMTAVKVENGVDVYNAEKGIITPEQVHRIEVADALVDTGSTYLAMPRRLIEQLGFEKPFTTAQARTTRGSVVSNIYGPVRLTIQDRLCNVDIAEVDDGCPVLVGQVPLEILDLVIDTKGQRLIGNPASGGEHMFDLY
jgi:predicted aspartyl protease